MTSGHGSTAEHGTGAGHASGGRPAQPPLTEEEAEEQAHGICFKTGPPGRVGVELEWLVCDDRDPALPVDRQRVADVLTRLDAPGALPGRGSLTTEPGGQVELSSAAAPGLGTCITAAHRDLATIRRALAPAGLRLAGHGIDPIRPPRRVLDLPRYVAMEGFFDRAGPWGRFMMCSTASVQVCLDAGLEADGTAGYRWRWHLLHALGPVLVASFANSPLQHGAPSGWKSTRQAVWSRLDPSRTRPPAGAEPEPGTGAPPSADPRASWVRYVLDAEVMCVRRPGSPCWTAPPGLTFRQWLRGPAAGRPTADDLSYHLSTLFPPVRPRGHLELRVIDAQPGDGWVVPAAVVTALLEDSAAAQAAMAVVQPLWQAAAGSSLWLRAARHGLDDPRLAEASQECFAAADAALGRLGAPAEVRGAVASFAGRYVLRGRCPADDRLAEARAALERPSSRPDPQTGAKEPT